MKKIIRAQLYKSLPQRGHRGLEQGRALISLFSFAPLRENKWHDCAAKPGAEEMVVIFGTPLPTKTRSNVRKFTVVSRFFL